jgi:hypothetical protein
LRVVATSTGTLVVASKGPRCRLACDAGQSAHVLDAHVQIRPKYPYCASAAAPAGPQTCQSAGLSESAQPTPEKLSAKFW